MQEISRPIENEFKSRMQVASLISALALLLLTSYGNAGVMFLVSLGAILAMAVWFLADRKMWLAIVSAVAFVAGVLCFSKVCF